MIGEAAESEESGDFARGYNMGVCVGFDAVYGDAVKVMDAYHHAMVERVQVYKDKLRALKSEADESYLKLLTMLQGPSLGEMSVASLWLWHETLRDDYMLAARRDIASRQQEADAHRAIRDKMHKELQDLVHTVKRAIKKRAMKKRPAPPIAIQ